QGVELAVVAAEGLALDALLSELAFQKELARGLPGVQSFVVPRILAVRLSGRLVVRRCRSLLGRRAAGEGGTDQQGGAQGDRRNTHSSSPLASAGRAAGCGPLPSRSTPRA